MPEDISKKVEELYKLEEQIMKDSRIRLQWGDRKVGRYNALKREISDRLTNNPERAFDFLAEIVDCYLRRVDEMKQEIFEEYRQQIDEAEQLKKDLAEALQPYLSQKQNEE